MGFPQFLGARQVETKRLVLVIGILFITVIVLESSGLPYKNVLLSLLSVKSGTVGELAIPNGSNYSDPSVALRAENNSKGSDTRRDKAELNGTHTDDDDSQLQEDQSYYESSPEELLVQGNSTVSQYAKFSSNGTEQEKFREPKEAYISDNEDSHLEMENTTNTESRFVASPPLALPPLVASTNSTLSTKLDANVTGTDEHSNSKVPSAGKQETETHSKDEKAVLLQSGPVITNNNSKLTSGHAKNRNRKAKPISMSQMRSLLLQSRVDSRSPRPLWSSVRDQELLYAKSQVENAPMIKKNGELDASLFQNVSMFQRSYELMEHMLKVYVYWEGEKPIFHQPELKGIYASEGWFMRLLEGNKQFVVKDPRKAHLFYLPFGSHVLRYTVSKYNLSTFLGNYVERIAANHNFWNRTSGADHFLVACHDWAPQITFPHMGTCVRALCNANAARGFKIGKDVSLPVTYVREKDDPLKGLGGKTPSRRPILAFFAGHMHGYLRPRLLQYWENKDPDMKIFGPLGRNNSGSMSYTQYMKSSKYCICARGYEVHTPRVVEAIFYGCVPVILSDNYVPPFFEILNWEAFSVFVAEKDIPNLKSILISIPEKKYLKLQQRVKKVQRHFLWHMKPVKYDIFHMTLHSIWYNRMFQIKPS